MGHKRTDVEVTKKMAKKFVRYEEGAELYSIGRTRFMQYAHEAHAVIKIDNICLVDCIKFEEFLDGFREF
jgi:L-fucose mutarotase/ribose pyranase (RbsD/FucU family)